MFWQDEFVTAEVSVYCKYWQNCVVILLWFSCHGYCSSTFTKSWEDK